MASIHNRRLIAALSRELKEKDSEIQELKQNIISLQDKLNDLAINIKHNKVVQKTGAAIIMASCIGWLLDISIDNDHVILWIKTEEGQTFKLRDSYHPGFYILPRNESDALRLQILSREEEIAVRWEYRRTNLFEAARNIQD